MAWLSKITWHDDALPKPQGQDLDNYGLDIRTWGDNVDGGGKNLTNLAELHGASATNILKFFTSGVEAARFDASGHLDLKTHNLSNVGTLTFTTLGGHVAGNAKNLTGLATLSFSLIDLGVASANVSQICNIYHNANVRSGWGMEAASAAMHIYAPTSNPKILSLGFNSSADGTTYTEKSYFDLNGCPVCPSTPTSSAGLPSGSIWRDAAAGNVLKMVP